MGKTTRWFRGLFSIKGSNLNPNRNPKDGCRWSFVRSYREKENKSSSNFNDVTATDAGGLVTSAIVIQSYFRGYLARRALRALKGLVKLQALVRGHIMRRRTAETMRCMQSMLRAQARATLVRACFPESSHSSSMSSQLNHAGPLTPENFEQIVRAKSSRQHQSSKIRRNLSRPSSRGNLRSSSWSSPHTDEPVWNLRKSEHPFDQTLNPLKLTQQFDDGNGLLNCTAENSTMLLCNKSEGSRSFLRGISDCPSYMSLTESSKAKMRSMSVPKQRHRYNTRPNAAMHTSLASKAYPGSGMLDRLGMPVKDSTMVYYSGYLN